jgi:hypothetical protein
MADPVPKLAEQWKATAEMEIRKKLKRSKSHQPD